MPVHNDPSWKRASTELVKEVPHIDRQESAERAAFHFFMTFSPQSTLQRLTAKIAPLTIPELDSRSIFDGLCLVQDS